MAPNGPPVTLRFALRTDSSATFAQRSRRADLCSAFLRRARPLLLAASSGTENRFSLANSPAARESLRVNPPVRIAMWSGPRNISTAMMRAWGNRRDTFVIDEPLYAYYLRATGRKHPGADEVIAAGEIDWRKVVALLTGPIPNSRQIFCEKPTASGPGIGMLRWQKPPRFSPIVPEITKCRSACDKLMSAAGSVTKGCMNIACVEPRHATQ